MCLYFFFPSDFLAVPESHILQVMVHFLGPFLEPIKFYIGLPALYFCPPIISRLAVGCQDTLHLAWQTRYIYSSTARPPSHPFQCIPFLSLNTTLNTASQQWMANKTSQQPPWRQKTNVPSSNTGSRAPISSSKTSSPTPSSASTYSPTFPADPWSILPFSWWRVPSSPTPRASSIPS